MTTRAGINIPARNERIWRLKSQGIPLKAIAIRMGLSYETVAEIVREGRQ